MKIRWYHRFWLKVKMIYYSRLTKQFPEALQCWYLRKTGERLDYNHPKTFNEKIQWLKVYDNIPEKTILSDKYRVREWVKDKIGEEYLIPLLGVWGNAREINFNDLPEQFVLKANHGCGWNIIIPDKKSINPKKIRKQLNHWLKINYAYRKGFELQYMHIKPLIIAEKYIENIAKDLFDYKFYCFNGEPMYCLIITGRFSHRKQMTVDLNFVKQPFCLDKGEEITHFEKPAEFEKMIELSRKLCQGFKHVRVDFYNVNGKIIFGEMTFATDSGIFDIQPREFAMKLGDMINI